MAMESAAVDELIEKGKFAPGVALAIAKAMELTIKAANLVTVPMLDARFRSLEKSILSTKVWALGLYAGLVIALFSALAVDHNWLVSRGDQLMALTNQRFDAMDRKFEAVDRKLEVMDRKFDAMQARSDQKFDAMQARSDQKFEAMLARWDQRFQQIESRMDTIASPAASSTTQPLPSRSRHH